HVAARVAAGDFAAQAGHDLLTIVDDHHESCLVERQDILHRIRGFQFGGAGGGVFPFGATDDVACAGEDGDAFASVVETRGSANMIEVQVAENDRVDLLGGDAKCGEAVEQGRTV